MRLEEPEPKHITSQIIAGDANNAELPAQVSENDVPKNQISERRARLERIWSTFSDFDPYKLFRVKPNTIPTSPYLGSNVIHASSTLTHCCASIFFIQGCYEGMDFKCQQEKRDPYPGDSYPYVTIVIYTNTKKYDPHSSYVEVNPVRLKCHLVFPEQTMKQAESYDLDVDLYGVINDEVTTVNFLETKIEIIMKKSESDGCHWEKLGMPFVEKKNKDPKDEVDDLEANKLNLAPTKPELSKETSKGHTDQEVIK